jgi:hypothetical protein
MTLDIRSELTMQTIYIDINIPRLAVTKALGRVWPGAYLSPISPTRFATQPDPPLPHPRSVRVRIALEPGSGL